MKEIAYDVGMLYSVVKQIRNHIIWNDVSKDYDFSHYNVRECTPPVNDEIIHAICKMLKCGDNPKYIAKHLNVPIDLVTRIYKKRCFKRISKLYNI